jgi:hypothetical protein
MIPSTAPNVVKRGQHLVYTLGISRYQVDDMVTYNGRRIAIFTGTTMRMNALFQPLNVSNNFLELSS